MSCDTAGSLFLQIFYPLGPYRFICTKPRVPQVSAGIGRGATHGRGLARGRHRVRLASLQLPCCKWGVNLQIRSNCDQFPSLQAEALAAWTCCLL